MPGQPPVLHHPLDMQALHTDQPISVHQPVGQLVLEVFPLVSDLLLLARDLQSSFVPTPRAFLSPRQPPLQTRQFPFALLQIAGIGYLRSVLVQREMEKWQP